MYAFCLSCPSATFAHQYSGFVPREWLPAKGLFKSLPVCQSTIPTVSLPVINQATQLIIQTLFHQ